MQTPQQIQQIATFKSHLKMIRSMKESQADQEFYKLLEKAKTALGDVHPQMAYFYHQYASFILTKMQNNIDILNAGAVPEQHQNQDQMDQIQEAFQDQESQFQNAQKKQKIQQNDVPQKKQIHQPNQQIRQKGEKHASSSTNQNQQQKLIYKDENVQITEDKHTGLNGVKNQQNHSQANAPQLPTTNEQLQDDDRQIAYQNFMAALNIYEEELNKMNNMQYSPLDCQQTKKNIAIVHSRIGDLYMLDQKYQEAIDQYRVVVKLQKERQQHNQGWKYNRRLSEMHYMVGNCLLYANTGICQKLAMREFILAVQILVKNLEILQNYEVSHFQIPTQNKVKVDRFSYLPRPGDNERVLQIKDVINALLDKLQDTFEQMQQKGDYQEQKQKMDKQKQQSGKFKQISEMNKNVKVVSLGTFGNKNKKAAPVDSQLNIQIKKQSQQSRKTPLQPQTILKQQNLGQISKGEHTTGKSQ